MNARDCQLNLQHIEQSKDWESVAVQVAGIPYAARVSPTENSVEQQDDLLVMSEEVGNPSDGPLGFNGYFPKGAWVFGRDTSELDVVGRRVFVLLNLLGNKTQAY
jgi:hypothetical protein